MGLLPFCSTNEPSAAQEEGVLGVQGVVPNSLDRLVVSGDGLVVVGTGEALGDGKGAA